MPSHFFAKCATKYDRMSISKQIYGYKQRYSIKQSTWSERAYFLMLPTNINVQTNVLHSNKPLNVA